MLAAAAVTPQWTADEILDLVWDYLIQPIFDKITSVISLFFQFLLSAKDSLVQALTEHIWAPLYGTLGPFWVILAVFLTGLTIFVVLWVIDQILNIL